MITNSSIEITASTVTNLRNDQEHHDSRSLGSFDRELGKYSVDKHN